MNGVRIFGVVAAAGCAAALVVACQDETGAAAGADVRFAEDGGVSSVPDATPIVRAMPRDAAADARDARSDADGGDAPDASDASDTPDARDAESASDMRDGSDASDAGDGAPRSEAGGEGDASDAGAAPDPDASDDADTAVGLDAGSAPPSDGGAMPDASDASDASPNDAGLCSELSPAAAPAIEQTAIGSARPPAIGGRLVDGLYFRTADTVYRPGEAAGPTGLASKEALTVAGADTATPSLVASFVEYIAGAAPDPNGVQSERFTFVPSGDGGAGGATLTFVCPDFGAIETTYTARTEGGRVVLEVYRDGDRIETFTRQ